MNLIELSAGSAGVAENQEGAKIPWNDPDFSRRMLENHLAQEHNWASRRKDIIAQHTAWIAKQLQPDSLILDMGCGPGLYTQALAKLGHRCVGVDFSPASIEYARKQAAHNAPDHEYILCDIRDYRTEQLFDCIIMTFGEFNVFTKQDATAILKNCSEMLRKGGGFILEAHTYEAVQAVGAAPATWQRYASGLFSDKPHLCLQENIWNARESSALSRYFIVDAASAEVQQYSSFMQAYTLEEYNTMLLAAKLLPKKILADGEWPSGQEFQGKLQVFMCLKN